jgi:hypothetical protein
VATDSTGQVAVVGVFADSIDFGGGPVVSAGSYDVFVAKLDADGEHLWSQRFGDAIEQRGSDIAMDDDGNVVVTGNFYSTIDFGGGILTSAGWNDVFVVKLAP